MIYLHFNKAGKNGDAMSKYWVTRICLSLGCGWFTRVLGRAGCAGISDPSDIADTYLRQIVGSDRF